MIEIIKGLRHKAGRKERGMAKDTHRHWSSGGTDCRCPTVPMGSGEGHAESSSLRPPECERSGLLRGREYEQYHGLEKLTQAAGKCTTDRALSGGLL